MLVFAMLYWPVNTVIEVNKNSRTIEVTYHMWMCHRQQYRQESLDDVSEVFVDAVKSMTVSDGLSILQGGDNAATDYLKEKTSASLKEAFMPKIKASISKVQLTNKWEPVANAYNKAMLLTGGKAVDPDLNNYVCDRAISGLFMLIADEEKKIRKDPVARVNDILKKVFGSPEANGGN